MTTRTTDLTTIEAERAAFAPPRETLQRIEDTLSPVYHAADEDTQDALLAVYEHSAHLCAHVEKLDGLIRTITDVASALKDQRDQASAKFTLLDQAVAAPWSTDNEKVRALVDEVTDTSLMTFWESLPYDIAVALGWEFHETNRLVVALETNPDEVDAEGRFYGYTPDRLRAFHADLLAALKRLHGEDE
jgi:hypothetical protein